MKIPSDSDNTGSEPGRNSAGQTESDKTVQDAAAEQATDADTGGPEPEPEPDADGTDTGTGGAGTGPTHSARRLRIDADSPFAEAAQVFAASDQAQLSALDVSAELFFNETVENLRLYNPHPGQPYAHATIAETVRRYHRERRSSAAAKRKKRKSKLPPFPRFRLDQTFYGWVHELSQAEDIAEFTTVLGATTARAYVQITSAMTLVHGLPKFFARCIAGEFTIEHVHATAHACRDVKFENLPLIDEYLAQRRADITIETFRKSLGMKIAVLEPLEERVEEASKRHASTSRPPPMGPHTSLWPDPLPNCRPATCGSRHLHGRSDRGTSQHSATSWSQAPRSTTTVESMPSCSTSSRGPSRS
ncbi:hypothetical protein PGC08_00405 [Brevibacterium sp. BDJS002]|uniref:hypothetical protein n=1 Tax=Brevibacterium sp. BDJS002 TaxID=3020906 RepID=UPI0023074EC3|nr:hypothetical protein [Brevibacterium sp. BDJS002]WCE40199.1 hypothetical protein PGC08_00405 [Brevibacterium sp. BDJS002]